MLVNTNTNTNRATEYTGDDKERGKRPLALREQARALRREGICDRRRDAGENRR
jgi:hypothetical protein